MAFTVKADYEKVFLNFLTAVSGGGSSEDTVVWYYGPVMYFGSGRPLAMKVDGKILFRTGCCRTPWSVTAAHFYALMDTVAPETKKEESVLSITVLPKAVRAYRDKIDKGYAKRQLTAFR